MQDPAIHWTDHYVKYGYAVIPDVLDPDFIEQAMASVKRNLKTNLEPTAWTTASPGRSFTECAKLDETSVLDKVYDQPGVRQVIGTMFGGPEHWDGKRAYRLFVSPYDPDASQTLSDKGHIDFVDCPIPALGSGFMFQTSLIDAEPFSGSITVYPGTHQTIQKHVMDDANWRFPAGAENIECPAPFEFVAKAGDMLVFHHLVYHASNPSHATGRTPRIVLHCQATREAWLESADPDRPNMSPWERSLSLNGAYTPHEDEKALRERHKAGAA